MKIHNVRLGHATNSSSSHSIIFDPVTKATDDYYDFGWSFFTLASKEAKEEYLAATLQQNLQGFSQPLVRAILKGLDLPTTEEHVDHQSQYTLPYDFGTTNISIDFFNDFRQYLLRDGVVILGGNDNEDTTHDLYDESKVKSFGNWYSEGPRMVCRKDGEWWTLYDRTNGNRVIFSFEDNPQPYKPTTPLLIDAKITDYCTHGCAYCYQGSTPQGKHMDDRCTAAYPIGEANVFEVAIGGGEPTQCPSFESFCESLAYHGVVANFTTKSTDWLEDERRARRILACTGAFAYSASPNSESILQRIYDIFSYRGYDLKKFTIQIIPAIFNKYQLQQLLSWCNKHNVRVTLLGYKTTGRGDAYKQIVVNKRWETFNESEWLSVLEEQHQAKSLGRISIDTTLAAKYLDQLKASSIPEWLYHVEEGKYSMYMDLVNKTYGPSSYHLDKLIKVEGYMKIEEMFSRIEPV